MKRWFAPLPLHRKIITIVLLISSVAVTAVVVGLLAFDVARFRSGALDDAEALARVVARNSAGAVVFNDPDMARQIVGSVDVRPAVSRACVYTANGALLAGYQQRGEPACPAVPVAEQSWRTLAAVVPVTHNDRTVGTVYVERRLTDLPARILVTAAAALVMLVLAGALAFALASRMEQLISRPIVALARAARAIGRDRFDLPVIEAPPDETGELVRAFGEMVQRLMSANAALKAEVDERTRMQSEREELLRREREASRLKDEFLAALSHELRTPLNAILGWTQVLESTQPDAGMVDKAIASVARNARAQSRVIEDLLDVSRIVTGKLQLSLTAVDVRTALQAAAEVIGPAATAKHVRLDVRVPPSPCMVQGDGDRLRQIFWNLLSNAVKFTPAHGSVTAVVTDNGSEFAIDVTDTGIGIAATFLPHVFERFRQADGSPTREHSGLGLGLAIVKDLVELHSGTVRASSPGAGLGATFLVSLPHLVGRAEVADVPLREARPDVRLDGIDVVTIDDNEDALQIVSSALTAAGARVRAFSSPLRALDDIRRAAPHVVLCDIAMPDMDGFGVLARIRAIDAERDTTTPVLAVTAYASAGDREKCARAGFAGHVAKPYDTAELASRVAALAPSPSV
jgi:signal transduction histidine kinase/CheY-like chemotaxis protein